MIWKSCYLGLLWVLNLWVVEKTAETSCSLPPEVCFTLVSIPRCVKYKRYDVGNTLSRFLKDKKASITSSTQKLPTTFLLSYKSLGAMNVISSLGPISSDAGHSYSTHFARYTNYRELNPFSLTVNFPGRLQTFLLLFLVFHHLLCWKSYQMTGISWEKRLCNKTGSSFYHTAGVKWSKCIWIYECTFSLYDLMLSKRKKTMNKQVIVVAHN